MYLGDESHPLLNPPILKREKIMTIQILTATTVLSDDEIKRLSLHEFRCPPVEDFITNAFDIIDNDYLTDDVVKDYADIESVSYVKIGNYVYSFTKMRNLENFISAVNRFNRIEQSFGDVTGLIESDLSSLTITVVYPAEIIDDIVQVNLDLYVESIKRSFYL